MVTEKLKLLNDQSYFLVSDVSVVCPRCGARLAANRSPVSLVPAGPGGFRCSPPRTRNAGAVGPHDPQVPVFRILLTRQLRTACAYRRTVAAGKVAGSFPRSGVRTTFACSSFLFPDCAAQSRTVRIAPHRVVPGLTVRPVLYVRYRVVPSGVFAPRRIAASGSRRSVAVLYPAYRASAPYPCRIIPSCPVRTASCHAVRIAPHRVVPGLTVRPVLYVRYRVVPSGVFAPRRIAASGSRRSVAVLYPAYRASAPYPCRIIPSCPVRTASCHAVRIAPHRVVPGLTVRPVLHCAVPGCSEAECSRRAVSQRPGRAVVWPCILCRTVQTLRIRAESSRPVPFAPRRSAGYGVSRRREILPAAPPFSDGDCGEDRSDEPKPKPSAPPRSNSQRDPRRQPFRCRRRKRGVPKAARGAVGSRPLPPFLPVVGASDSLLSAAGTARSPVRRHSPNRRR